MAGQAPFRPDCRSNKEQLFVRIVPVFVLLMTGEAVQYIHSIFTDFVDYSRLFCYVFNMTGDAMFHMFAGWPRLYFLKMREEYRFHILLHLR